jgi:putative hydrolase of HD superfamily
MSENQNVHAPPAAERIHQQIAFLMEADRVKTIFRRNRVVADPTRHENDAEHMYHFALLAIILAEYSNAPVDLPRVLKMILIHDLVEIDAGDTFVYDVQAQVGKREREELAATRIFGLLPADQAGEMRTLWEEFEAEESGEARFAAALDRLQPLLCNYYTQGGAWKEYGVHADQIFARNSKIAGGSTELWAYARTFLDDALAKGYMSNAPSHTASD